MTDTLLLFVIWDGGGSAPPILEVARQLIERGYSVDVLAPRVLRDAVTRVGAGYVPYNAAPEHDSRSKTEDLLRDWEAKLPWQLFELVRERVTVGPASLFAADVLEYLSCHHVAAVFSDYLLLGVFAAAERRHIPCVALFHQVYTLPVEGSPIVGAGLLPGNEGWRRLRDRGLRSVYRRLFNRGLPTYNELRANLGLEPLACLFDVIHRAERTWVLSCPEFDFTSAYTSNKTVYVGPQIEPIGAEADAQLVPKPTARPCVVVSFSTTYQGQRSVVQQVILAAKYLDVEMLVTLGPALSPGDFEVPDGVTLKAFVPHSVAFRSADLVITHGGHGTVMTALSLGVPILCMPMGRDQHDNASRILRLGAGAVIGASCKSAAIARAIKKLLLDAEAKAAAERAAKAIGVRARELSVADEAQQLFEALGKRK